MKNFKRHSFIFSICIVIIFIIIGFFLINQFTKNTVLENIKSIKIAGQNIKVELAISEAEKSKGLSARQGLADNEGMLFIFENPNKYSFWMKDMKFPIDIIWLASSESEGGEEVKVVYIKKDARLESYPETFSPDKNAKYILEISSGFSEKNNLKVGDQVLFTY